MVVADSEFLQATQKNLGDRSDAILQPSRSLRGVRIIIVIGIFDLGGSERQAIHLAQYLRDVTGADVEVWGCDISGGRVVDLCHQYKIPWHTYPMPWVDNWGNLKRYRAVLDFALQLRRAHADVLVPFITLTNVFCGLVWRFTGARLCIWNQREAGITTAVVGPKTGRLATRLTPWFFSNSQHGADYLINEHKVSPARVSVIHNTVELLPSEHDTATWRRKLNVGQDSFLAVKVANLHELKDHVTLLKAWRIVTENFPATLLLAGRWDGTQNSLKILAVDLGISRYVRLLGAVKDVSGLLRACDLAVFSSFAEGSPNGVLECMAAGLAVAATDVPGIREAVAPDGLPFLAPVRDAETLAAKILALAENEALRKRLGDINRERIQTMFSVPRLGEATARVISRALEAAG
jgi:glycosyltransferase involved in cell wall biosynthesis